MAQLRTKVVSHREVDYNDLEELIQKTYGRKDYSIIAAEEWGNDSSHEVEADTPRTLDEFEQKDLDEFKAGKGYGQYMLGTLVQDLCNQGLIEPGEYLVQVCW